MRSLVKGLLLGTVVAVVALPAVEIVSPAEARAESDLTVGTRLVALANVTLQKAEILKGSKVSVTKLLRRSGEVDGVAVELADGHVVKVAISTVRSLFRVTEE